MKQIEWITYMEQILDEAVQTLSSLSHVLEQYSGIQNKLQKLIAYYTCEQWRQDFDDDSADNIPGDLKRGVLSEDQLSISSLVLRCELKIPAIIHLWV